MKQNELIEMDLDEINELKEEESQEWKIDSEGLANWAIGKVIEEQDRFEMYKNATNEQIEILKNKLKEEHDKSDGRTSFLRYKLSEWLNTVPAKKTKTKASLKLPNGTISKIYSKEILKPVDSKTQKDSVELLEYCKTYSDKDFIDCKETVKWGELKKILGANGDDVITIDVTDSETGEITTKQIPSNVVYNKQTGEVVSCLKIDYSLPEIKVSK